MRHQFSLVQSFSCVWLFASPWTVACQTSLSIINLELTQTYPSSQWCHPTISSPYPPTFNLSQHQGLFQWVSSSHPVAKVLEFQPQHQSFQWIFRTHFLEDWLVWSPCSLRDSQQFSPTSQFKSINSSALSFLYSPTVKSSNDYGKNQSFD